MLEISSAVSFGIGRGIKIVLQNRMYPCTPNKRWKLSNFDCHRELNQERRTLLMHKKKSFQGVSNMKMFQVFFG